MVNASLFGPLANSLFLSLPIIPVYIYIIEHMHVIKSIQAKSNITQFAIYKFILLDELVV